MDAFYDDGLIYLFNPNISELFSSISYIILSILSNYKHEKSKFFIPS